MIILGKVRKDYVFTLSFGKLARIVFWHPGQMCIGNFSELVQSDFFPVNVNGQYSVPSILETAAFNVTFWKA